MSNLVNELLGKVSALTQTVNQLLSKSKSIPELPSQNTLDGNSLLHVSKRGTSEKITVQQIVNAAVNRDNDQLLTVGAMSLTGNDFTIDAISWKINNIVHDISTPTTINIPFCPTGLNRIDLIIADSNGNITRQAGAETAGAIIIAPTLLVGNLLITQVSVSDSVIGNPSNPILGSTYQQKQFDYLQTYTGTGTDVVIPLNTTGRSHIQLKGTMTSVAGLSFADLVANHVNAEYPHYGKRFLFFNDSGHDIILKHLVGTEDIFFTFKEETDLVFPNGEFLEFFNSSNVFINVFRSWKDISTKQDVLTSTNFGTFSNSLTTDDTIPDAGIFNYTNVLGIQVKTTWANIKAKLNTLYQAVLVSGTNIKTINGTSILGSGNLTVGGGSGDVKLIYKTTTSGTTVTNSPNSTNYKSRSVLIPANTFAVGDFIKIEFTTIKLSGGNVEMYSSLNINTIDSLSGATVLSNSYSTVSGVFYKTIRTLAVKRTTGTEIFHHGTNSFTDIIQANTRGEWNIDWTSDKYLIFAINGNGDTASTFAISTVLITKI